jgi:hypothetical protein
MRNVLWFISGIAVALLLQLHSPVVEAASVVMAGSFGGVAKIIQLGSTGALQIVLN